MSITRVKPSSLNSADIKKINHVQYNNYVDLVLLFRLSPSI
jgi:hypothetical protein